MVNWADNIQWILEEEYENILENYEEMPLNVWCIVYSTEFDMTYKWRLIKN